MTRKFRIGKWGSKDSLRRPIWQRQARFETLESRTLLSAGPGTGADLLVHGFTTNTQGNPKIASDAAGDTIVVWQAKDDGSGYGIFAERYSAAGSPQGSKFQVNTYTTGDQVDPSVAMDSAGDFVVAWQTYGEIEAQRYAASGAAQGSEFRVDASTSGDQSLPVVAMDSAGDIVIAWQNDYLDIFAQRYSAARSAQGSIFQVNSVSGGLQSNGFTIHQVNPAVAMDSAGDFFVAWDTVVLGSAGSADYGQLYNAQGAAVGSNFPISPANKDGIPAVAMDSAGDFVVAWSADYGVSGRYGVFAERYNAAEVPQGSVLQPYTGGSSSPVSVAMDAAGDFTVVWDPPRSGLAFNSADVVAESFNAAGVPQGSEFLVNGYTVGNQSFGSIAMDSAGDFAVVWSGWGESGYGIYARNSASGFVNPKPLDLQVNTYNGSSQQPAIASDTAGDTVIVWSGYGDSGQGIYAQRYNAAGQAQGSNFRVNTFTTGTQAAPAVAMDLSGDFVVVWSGENVSGSGDEIYAQLYNAAGNAVGSEFQANTNTTTVDSGASVAMDSAGDFVVTWNAPPVQNIGSFYHQPWSGTDTTIYGQRYGSSGAAEGSAFVVGAGNAIRAPQIAADAAGDFVIVWHVSYQDPVFGDQGQVGYVSGYEIVGQLYSSSGAAVGNQFVVANGTDPANLGGIDLYQNPVVAMDAEGDFAVGFTAFGSTIPSSTSAYVQTYNSAGVAQGSTSQPSAPAISSIAMDPAGDYAITWQESTRGLGPSLSNVFAQRYNAAGVAQGSQFQVNSDTTGNAKLPSVAMDAQGDLFVAWQEGGSQDTYNIYAQAYAAQPFTVQGNTLTINGGGMPGPLFFEFEDATDFDFTFDGTDYYYYSTSQVNHVVFNAMLSGFTQATFYDNITTDAYNANQAFSSTTINRTGGVGFEFDANGATNFYAYVFDPTSTATVGTAAGGGASYYVDDAADGYSYIADPATGVYSELSGFGPQTVTGSNGSTYAYIYSTSNAAFVGDPGGSTLTVGGATTSLSGFSQLYVVGASDGTDSVTLDSGGGPFVGTPGFSYVGGTLSQPNYFVAALYAHTVHLVPAGVNSTAVIYSYPGDVFSGSSFTGETSDANGSSYNFQVLMGTFASLTVFESGSGTDSVALNLPGTNSASLIATPTATAITLASQTITVNSFELGDGTQQFVPVPTQIEVAMASMDSQASASLYDGPGSNSIVASGSGLQFQTPTLKLSLQNFAAVNAYQQQGSNDTVHQQAIDYALQLFGNWTSV